MDIDNSTAIDTVRSLLSNDFTRSCTAWLHLIASLITDMQNGICQNLLHNPLQSWHHLLKVSESPTYRNTQIYLILRRPQSFPHFPVIAI